MGALLSAIPGILERLFFPRNPGSGLRNVLIVTERPRSRTRYGLTATGLLRNAINRRPGPLYEFHLGWNASWGSSRLLFHLSNGRCGGIAGPPQILPKVQNTSSLTTCSQLLFHLLHTLVSSVASSELHVWRNVAHGIDLFVILDPVGFLQASKLKDTRDSPA